MTHTSADPSTRHGQEKGFKQVAQMQVNPPKKTTVICKSGTTKSLLIKGTNLLIPAEESDLQRTCFRD